MQSFDIYFLGEMLPEAEPAAVRRGVARLFKVEDDAVDRLFSGQAVRVKKGLDAEAASFFRRHEGTDRISAVSLDGAVEIGRIKAARCT